MAVVSAPPHGERGSVAALARAFWRFAPTQVAALLALMLLVALIEGTGLLLLSPVLSMMTGGAQGGTGAMRWIVVLLGPTPRLGSLLAFYVVLVLVHAVGTWQRDLRSMALQQDFIDTLRLDLFRNVGAAEWRFLTRIDAAEISHSLTVDVGRTLMSLQSMLQGAVTLPIALAYALVLLRLSWPLTLLTILLCVLMIWPLRRQNRRVQALGRELTHETQSIHGQITEFLAGLKVAKAANAESLLADRFGRRLARARSVILAFTATQAQARLVSRIAAAAGLLGFAWLGVGVLAMPATDVLVMAFALMRLLPMLSTVQQLYERLLHGLPAYQAFMALCRRCLEHRESRHDGLRYTLRTALHLQSVSYRHRADSAQVLHDLTLNVRAHCTTAIIGPSGAGKSTLADLLAGLVAPTHGRILIDGVPLDARHAWREQVAYVSQDIFLFNASVRENLGWGASQLDETALWQALEQAAAADFVRALPQGLDTVVGERGLQLSGGERQRLAIARALVRQPALLILDEATSALDSDNERSIQEAVARLHGQITIVVIAHRLSTVREADHVLVLERGRLSEQGRFEALRYPASRIAVD
jgi:ATP-binding cassette, subfamily C, bacterial